MNTYTQHPIGKLIPKLQGWEYEDLKTDIQKRGIQDPIVLFEGQILDGWHRFRIAEELGLDPSFREYAGEHPKDIVESSIQGRNLTQELKIGIMLKLNEIPESNGGNKSSTIKLTVNAPSKGAKGFTSNADPDSNRSIAKKMKVAHTAVNKVAKLQKESPEMFDKFVGGEINFADAKRESKRKEITTKLEAIVANAPQTPTGKFQVMVIDPPWPIHKIERDCRENQTEALDYPTMSVDEISSLPIVNDFADTDCHVFVWTTQKYLPDTFNILKQWGVNYVFTMTWHKPGGFQVCGLPQYNSEFILYGKIGNPQFIDTKAFNTCFNAPRGKHSEKPREFYDLLNRVTGGRRLDVFNRRKIEGFIGYGNEAKV